MFCYAKFTYVIHTPVALSDLCRLVFSVVNYPPTSLSDLCRCVSSGRIHKICILQHITVLQIKRFYLFTTNLLIYFYTYFKLFKLRWFSVFFTVGEKWSGKAYPLICIPPTLKPAWLEDSAAACKPNFQKKRRTSRTFSTIFHSIK